MKRGLNIQELIEEIKTLKDEIKSLKNRKKYGLVWEDKPEQVVSDCQNKLPILKEVKTREIKTDKDKPVNILIEGDNYHSLSVLNYTHRGGIDFIYIDPPYNTKYEGFVYNDKLVDINDRYRHSKYLSYLNKRLKLAKNVLRKSGIIAISIGEDEFANLKLLLDDIFEEKNYIGNIARLTKRGGNKGEFLKPKKDYIICYAKSLESVSKKEFGKSVNKKAKWILEDFNGEKRKYIKGDIPYRANLETRKNQRYYIEAPDGSLMIPPGDIFPKIKKDAEMIIPQTKNDKCWTWSRSRYLEERLNERFIFIKSNKSPFVDENGDVSKWTVYKKVFESDIERQKEILIDFLDTFPNSLGTAELKELDIDFPYPKPSFLIQWLFNICASENAIALDFFAGSGTTGHAVLRLNKEDGGNRKFILCTNNENKIAEEICYPRISKVIKGYKNKKGDKVEGLGGNLKYYKADFIDSEHINKISDDSKVKLTYQAGEMIALREDTLDEIEKNEWWQIFTDGEKQTAIYFKEDKSRLKKLIEKLSKNKKSVLYIFSWGKNEYKNEFSDYKNIRIEDIPEPILEVYKELNKL